MLWIVFALILTMLAAAAFTGIGVGNVSLLLALFVVVAIVLSAVKVIKKFSRVS
ncbi:hypothetical protein [Bacillus sp. FJAT-45037]|uniref:hypothetical protein n=1 Tax=Bacillus sp. FJAT-45037 TaxID=2011007 RepID=UPI0012FE0F6D|nr:hypothetical protein [Bacillus sp. FJAT-45037]